MTNSTDPYENLRALGLTLPTPRQPVANFVAAMRDHDRIYLSGQAPRDEAGLRTGKVGRDFTAEEAYFHARLAGLNLLAVLEAELGTLHRVRQVLKVLGMINAVPEFSAHPQVMNGCSDLFMAVFGPEVGRHARSAVGMASLPSNISVEIEATVAVDD